MTFAAATVQLRLAALGCPWRAAVHHVDVTASTQDLARAAAAERAPEGTTFVADEQTHGRGRQGRSWVAPRGSALLTSVLLRPALRPPQLPPLALVVGLALHDALAPRLTPGALLLKWPNDLTLHRRKVGGVLVEASMRGERVESVVVGFGLNLTAASLPPAIASAADCLQAHALPGADLSREDVLASSLAAIERRTTQLVRQGLGALLSELRAADGTAGRSVRWQEQQGVARGIDDEGRLRIETDTGTVAAAAGEVVFL